jgi:hypothetical protein
MRWVVVITVLLATTFSGLSTQSATAATVPASKRIARVPTNPVETVFAFGDALDAVNYQVAFEPEARNLDRLTAACRSVFARQPSFESALRATKAKDIAHDLLTHAQPTVELCFNPLAADEDAAGRAAEAFATFRERAFDFAAARK